MMITKGVALATSSLCTTTFLIVIICPYMSDLLKCWKKCVFYQEKAKVQMTATTLHIQQHQPVCKGRAHRVEKGQVTYTSKDQAQNLSQGLVYTAEELQTLEGQG